MADIITCMSPTAPAMECNHTAIYGAPKSRLGRTPPSEVTNIAISGIAVHCVKDSFNGYLAKACIGSTKMPIGCHVSFHYIIDAETGYISSLVAESDLAWAWQAYRSNFPLVTPLDYCQCPVPCPAPPCGSPEPIAVTYPGWTVLSAQFPNLSADFYTINIGVTSPSRPEQSRLDNENCCVGPYGLTDQAYRQLIRLIAYLQAKYSSTILLDDQHIAFHDEIVTVEEDCLECPCGANGACLICDVSAYCERCLTPGDPTIAIDTCANLKYIYGENAFGCRVKIPISELTFWSCSEEGGGGE